jgi:hypothetical protein
MKQCGRLGLALVIATLACACGWWKDLEASRDENLRSEHAAALLAGYADYRTVMFDADTEVVWFDYRLPQHIDVGSAAEAIVGQITTKEPCYRKTESSPTWVRIRCQGAAADRFQEYVVGVVPGPRTISVMHAAIEGPAETAAYPLTVARFGKRLDDLRR